MATQSQIRRLRADIGATTAALSDADATDIFEEAATDYGTDAAVIKAATRVIAIRRIRASAARMVTYKQNQTTMNASDVFKHLTQLLETWENDLTRAQEAALASGAVKIGALRQVNRPTEWPNS